MKKRILHVQVLPKMSGVQRVSYELLQSLDNEKYDKFILFSSYIDAGDKDYCVNLFESAGIKVLFSNNLVREISLYKDFKAFLEICKLCKNYRFDIVHTHSTKPGIIGRIAARISKVPKVIHTVHGVSYHMYVPFLKRTFYYLIEFFASFFSHRIVLVNNYYRKYYRFFKRKIEVIPNGIDYSQLPVKTPAVNAATDVLKLLFVGRLDIPKDPLTLIKAIQLIISEKKRTNVLLTMVGDGEIYKECNEYIINNDLSNYIKLVGWKTNVYEYYQVSDIFCTSSIYEAFGIMFLEAGYYSLPTIATSVEGIPEVVLDNKTGILVPPQQEAALADAILILLDNPDLRKELGSNARSWVTKQFTAEKIISQYLSIYTQPG